MFRTGTGKTVGITIGVIVNIMSGKDQRRWMAPQTCTIIWLWMLLVLNLIHIPWRNPRIQKHRSFMICLMLQIKRVAFTLVTLITEHTRVAFTSCTSCNPTYNWSVHLHYTYTWIVTICKRYCKFAFFGHFRQFRLQERDWFRQAWEKIVLNAL